MAIHISTAVLQKLADKHQVTRKEVRECFLNRSGQLLHDTREEHKSDPPTLWFIAPTNKGRLLKDCFILRGTDAFLRTAFDPNADEMGLYRKKGKPSDF